MEYLNDGPLAQLWEHAVFKEDIAPEAASRIDINGAIDALRAHELPLPVAGELLHALSRVLDLSTDSALADAKEANRELYNTFKEQISVNDGGEVEKSRRAAPPLETGLELGDLALPDSLIARRNQTAPEDISLDAIVREDRSADALDDSNVLEEVPQRSAEELEALAALDLGAAGDDDDGDDAAAAGADDGFDGFDDLAAIPDSDAGLDFGSDLAASSSPPHTPRDDHELPVHIGQSSSPPAARADAAPKRRAPRRHGAPVDDVLSMARPTKPTAQILRRPNTVLPRREPPPAADAEFIPLDDATERLVDAAFVQAEMKRRRLGGDFSLASAGDSEPVDADLPELADAAFDDAGFDDAGFDDAFDMDVDMGAASDGDVSRIASEAESSGELDEPEPVDTAEALKEGAAAARAALHAHLKKKGQCVQFDDLATTPAARADTLLEVLMLAAKGRVAPRQDAAWGAIAITQL